MDLVILIMNIYLIAGVVFAIGFISKGVTRVDTNAAGSSIWFRLLLLPGTVLLWPVLAVKWIKSRVQ